MTDGLPNVRADSQYLPGLAVDRKDLVGDEEIAVVIKTDRGSDGEDPMRGRVPGDRTQLALIRSAKVGRERCDGAVDRVNP